MKARSTPDATKPATRRRRLLIISATALVGAAIGIVAWYPQTAAPIGTGAAVAAVAVPYLRRN
ncbi:hypothetical protein [Kitasatospora sp. NPDC008115]|uniref:hypothetical protein n=1 Tax=Kitasatospora sp. NPDC008115 TaxID=3364022 RepID=UPI0036E696C5